MKRIILAVVLLTFCFTQIEAQNYNKIMSKAIKKSIGTDLKGYQVFSYPTDNFGLITSYDGKVSDENFICDMWNCIGVAPAQSSTLDWLNLNGYAGVGTGGSISLEEKKKTTIAAKVILPKIYDVVGVTGGFKNERTTDITINIGTAYLRKLRKDKISEYINSLSNSTSEKKAYNNGNLVLIVADCVIENLSVTVKVDQTTSADLDVKIGNTGGGAIVSKVFTDGSLSVSVERVTSGTYTFKVSHPVIFARLAKKQPGAGTLGGNDDFDNWENVDDKLDKSFPKSGH